MTLTPAQANAMVNKSNAMLAAVLAGKTYPGDPPIDLSDYANEVQRRLASGDLSPAQWASLNAKYSGLSSYEAANGPGMAPMPATADASGSTNTKSFLAGIPNPVLYAAGAVAAVGVGGAIAAGIARHRRKRKASGHGRKGGHRRGSGSGRGRTRRSGPRKARNRRGGAVRDRYKGRKVYRTKRGQPYILMANGKARFVKA